MSWHSPSLASLEEGAVSIVDAETSRDATFYLIQLALKSGEAWKVARRYSQFKDLHERLSSMFSIGDSLNLPPKRVFNNNDPSFIQKRRAELQEYLRSVILNLVPPCPHPLKVFLTDNLYDFREINHAILSSSAGSRTTTTTTSKTTTSTMSSNSAWSDGNFRPLIEIESPKPEVTPAFSPSFSAPPNPPSVQAPNLPFDVIFGIQSDSDSGLDAFGMSSFGGVNAVSAPAAPPIFVPSFASNASIIPLPPNASLVNNAQPPNVASRLSAAAAAAPASSLSSTLYSSSKPHFGSEEDAEARSKSKSKWFDNEPAKRSNAVRFDQSSGGLVRDALSSGASAEGARFSSAVNNIDHADGARVNGAQCNGVYRGGQLSSIIPAFPDLHRDFQKQIFSTYSEWKKMAGLGSTVFVNDLVSF